MMTLLLLLVLLQAQANPAIPLTNAPPQSTAKQSLPSKENPQGYSPEMFEDSSKKPAAQPSAAPAAAPAKLPEYLAELVKKQFGDCEIALQRSAIHTNYVKPDTSAWTPFLTGDINGDGIEDAVIAARCTDILAGQGTHNYKVSDPYFTANGYGDPKITSSFASGDPMQGNMVLIIFGSGAEAWRAAEPKAKFLLINLPFDNLALSRVANKKAKGIGVELQAMEGSSLVFWDGKKYVWRDVGFTQ